MSLNMTSALFRRPMPARDLHAYLLSQTIKIA